jgi:hypothetical protein
MEKAFRFTYRKPKLIMPRKKNQFPLTVKIKVRCKKDLCKKKFKNCKNKQIKQLETGEIRAVSRVIPTALSII